MQWMCNECMSLQSGRCLFIKDCKHAMNFPKEPNQCFDQSVRSAQASNFFRPTFLPKMLRWLVFIELKFLFFAAHRAMQLLLEYIQISPWAPYRLSSSTINSSLHSFSFLYWLLHFKVLTFQVFYRGSLVRTHCKLSLFWNYIKQLLCWSSYSKSVRRICSSTTPSHLWKLHD